MNQEEQRTLSLFEAVDGNERISQRQLAQELGLSLGLTNAFLQTVLHKGWVRARQVSARRWAYFLTPEGFREKSRLTMNYLRRTMHSFQELKTLILQHFTELELQGCQRIHLCSEGDLQEIIRLPPRALMSCSSDRYQFWLGMSGCFWLFYKIRNL
jgi:DNA-binding MarR family transcriptional regulator